MLLLLYWVSTINLAEFNEMKTNMFQCQVPAIQVYFMEHFCNFHRPQTKLREGDVVFTGISLSTGGRLSE